MNNKSILEELIHLLNNDITPLTLDCDEKFSSLLNQIGEARFVLIGEASHGTDEFYQTRMAISRLLIEKKGFHAIAIEGDWPSAYPVNRYVQGYEPKEAVKESLMAFNRFPLWMWRNTTLPPFLSWLREYNDNLPQSSHKVGFYGLDLYSLHESMQAIIEYLQKYDPSQAKKAISRFNCFDHAAIDPQLYGYLVNKQVKHNCIKEVTDQLLEMQHTAFSELNKEPSFNAESLYYATQNARLVKNAEEYYRSMFGPRAISWNIRDHHMAQTLSNLIAYIETNLKTPAKIIIWAHNSHVGDARATEMHDRGEINLGQIVREHYDTASYLLGFSTYEGTVRAASDWGATDEEKVVLPALNGSYEALFHGAATKNFFLNLRGESHLIHLLKQPELQRAIGVIYLPETERMSHYYFSQLPYQFDGIIHIDKTRAVMPIDKYTRKKINGLPETFPSGI